MVHSFLAHVTVENLLGTVGFDMEEGTCATRHSDASHRLSVSYELLNLDGMLYFRL